MANRRTISTINVTPLVDVMLVLLVIFMVTAPMMESGMDINLPKAEAGALNVEEEPIIVSVDKAGRVFINKASVPGGELKASLTALFEKKKDKTVFLEADSDVPYGKVAVVMADIRKAGAGRVGMLTEPPDSKGAAE